MTLFLMIPIFSALSGHRSDTLKTSLHFHLRLSITAVIPRNNGGDSQIIISTGFILLPALYSEVVTNEK